MVSVRPPVVIVANDVVPGSEMPVAAPGLRAFGLAEGLAAHGIESEIVVVSGPVDRQWRGEVPPPTRPGTILLDNDRLAEYLEARSPAIVIITNSNQIDWLRKPSGVRLILDFFAPKMLELAYRDDAEYPVEALRSLRARKIRAIEQADAFIVNGAKKIPYFLGWLLQADRNIRTADLAVVPMGVPGRFAEKAPGSPIRLVNAGYLQGWSQHGRWVEVLQRVLEGTGFELHVLTPQHWGRPEPQPPSAHVRELLDSPAVVQHSTLRFADFQEFLSNADVSVDLFDWSWEREYAMVTRTVVALACGVPVIHPPFTEVAPVIDEHDAGWLVDPGDESALESVFAEIRSDPDSAVRKSHNARVAWAAAFEPGTATAELARIVRKLMA